jgi:hypothetical protein
VTFGALFIRGVRSVEDVAPGSAAPAGRQPAVAAAGAR